MKLAFIFGTRPEIIKMSPLIRQCIEDKIPFFSIHTGQHYTHNMSELFLEELKLPEPYYNLEIKSKAPYKQGDHTGRMMMELEDILLKEMPTTVLVHGDTNTTLAGALVTSKISTTRSFTGFDIKLAHVEAGLRSYDRTMPEEINRVIVDHLSDYLFVPTENAKNTALGEGIVPSKIFVTGNTIVDALYYGLKTAGNENNFLTQNDLTKGNYILLTLHRQENVDDEKRITEIIAAVEKSAKEFGLPIIFPIHPRTVKMLKKFKIKIGKAVKLVQPCGFLEFLELEANAAIVFTDSGGLQEESCVLRVPCVTLRTTTERPETVEVGANIIAGVDPNDIIEAARVMIAKDKNWINPFGDGTSAKIILQTLKESC